jgi:hypothetical protein
MPLIDDPSVGQSLLTPRGYVPLAGSDEETKPDKPPVEKPAASFIDTIAPNPSDAVADIVAGTAGVIPSLLLNNPTGEAALRQNNTIVSAMARLQDTYGVSNDLVDPNYSPWLDVAGTPYEQYWRSTFASSNNHQYTEALKRSIDRQEKDKRTVDASGFYGTVSGIAAGAIDPTMLLPVGGEVNLVGKGVWSVGRGVVAGARAGAIGTTAYELALQGSQDTRPLSQSLINVGTGTILGAVIGGSIAGALTRTQRVASEAGLEHIANMNVPGSVGAAAPEHFTLDDMTINGKIAENIAAGTAFSPNLRGNFRESPLARQTYQEIATNVLRQNMHEAGESLGPSVETNINVSLGETLGSSTGKASGYLC